MEWQSLIQMSQDSWRRLRKTPSTFNINEDLQNSLPKRKKQRKGLSVKSPSTKTDTLWMMGTSMIIMTLKTKNSCKSLTKV